MHLMRNSLRFLRPTNENYIMKYFRYIFNHKMLLMLCTKNAYYNVISKPTRSLDFSIIMIILTYRKVGGTYHYFIIWVTVIRDPNQDKTILFEDSNSLKTRKRPMSQLNKTQKYKNNRLCNMR